MKLNLAVAVMVGIALLPVAPAAHAQAYPLKPVRVPIPWPPGGSTDIVGRIVFQRVGETLGQQFVLHVPYKGGGPAVIALASGETLDPMYMTPEQFAQRMKSDDAKYERVVRVSGAKVE